MSPDEKTDIQALERTAPTKPMEPGKKLSKTFLRIRPRDCFHGKMVYNQGKK
jgi:ribosomal protein S27E